MPSITPISIRKVNSGTISDLTDLLTVEEPLEIRLEYGPPGSRLRRNISVTMRTPGSDFELATGFLYTEGIIHSRPILCL